MAELYLYNGTFDHSDNIITRDRIIDPKILGPGFDFTPFEDDYYDKGDVTFLKFRTEGAGTYVAGISTKARTITLSGGDFTNYLEHEGLTNIIADRKAKGISGSSAREKYAKHVKAILQVGDQKTDHFSSVFGYPIEFIPLTNPYELKSGDMMSVKLLFEGKPLGNQIVHIGSRQSMKDSGQGELALKTDVRGELSFEISNVGQWYAATIYMQESKERRLDYVSSWATLTFEVR